MRLQATLSAALAAAALATACGQDVNAPGVHFDIVVEGWLERGNQVDLLVLRDGTPVPSGSVTWSAEPAAAAEFVRENAARLRDIGTVTFHARVDGRSVSRAAKVARPPVVVFDLVHDGNRDIYRVDLDGENLQRLTFHQRDDVEPTVAGGRVIFTSWRNGKADLFSVALSGGNVEPIAESSVAERSPALSPDGSRLLFTREINGIPKLVLRHLVSGAEERPLAGFGHDGAIETNPTWSHSGEEIAFVSTAEGNASIFHLPPEAESPAKLASSEHGDFDPAWSPRGRTLAFASNRDGETDLYLYDLGPRSLTRLTERDGSDGQPAWLPDGRIVFTTWTEGTPRLQWIDPARPQSIHDIPTGEGAARNPAAALRP